MCVYVCACACVCAVCVCVCVCVLVSAVYVFVNEHTAPVCAGISAVHHVHNVHRCRRPELLGALDGENALSIIPLLNEGLWGEIAQYL